MPLMERTLPAGRSESSLLTSTNKFVAAPAPWSGSDCDPSAEISGSWQESKTVSRHFLSLGSLTTHTGPISQGHPGD